MRALQLCAVALACSAATACGSSFGVTPDGGTGGTTGNGGAGGGAVVCALDAAYQYGDTGGFAAYEDTVRLMPPSGYTYNRTPRGSDADISCAPALRPCGDGAAIDVGEVMAAILDPAVQAALSAPGNPTGMVSFGRDDRPVDGSVFRFARTGGAEFLVGSQCMPSSAVEPLPCIAAIPPGITRLIAALRALDEQQLQDASCAALR